MIGANAPAGSDDRIGRITTVPSDITEENRFGQRSDVLPWFWRLGGQNEDQHDTWMEECKFIVFYKSNC